ncbi:transmembrane protein 53-like [Genypterus blacodes]|uniref:transmembrane protein 53-like n=1 Tax=Genypterus blacodes TaxID=154954 RepID=UPI003F774D3D
MGNLRLTSLLSADADLCADGLTCREISPSIIYYCASAGEQTNCPARGAPPLPPCTPLISGPPILPDFACTSPPGSPRPLLLLFSWLGARQRGLAKYRDLYLERGMDVLVVQSSVMHFLWPRWGLEYGLEVLKVLEDPAFLDRPVLAQAFSIGGYTFTQMLTHIAHGPEKYASLTQRMKGHVYDSLVAGSVEHMATGLGLTLFPRLDFLVKHTALLYFWLFKKHTTDLYNNSIHVFNNSPLTTPALFFSCENDLLCDSAALEEIVDRWQKRGVAVEHRKWKESTHAAHMQCHPEDYVSTLDKYLNTLHLHDCTLREE